MALMVGLMKSSVFLFYTYAFLVGSFLIQNQVINNKSEQAYTGSDILTVIVSLITGFMTLISALPSFQNVMAAKVVGRIIFDVIDRVPKIRDLK
jgi:hypothetical protein